MGVSVSAVYKWESGQSVPDIRLILEMADLFHTSTDVLLGYEWRNNNITSAMELMETLAREERYDEAAAEAEKALKSYPNSFDIVYRSALLYLKLGEAEDEKKANMRAVKLLNHACELIEQNRDEDVSEVSIKAMMADAYLMLQNTDAALRILKRYNVCGVNNARIGMVLADFLHDTDAAEPYLNKAFSTFAKEINDIMIGYANVFFQRKDYQGTIDCLLWLRKVLRGIQPETELTWFDKYDCVLLETIAECYCFMGDFEMARSRLGEAIRRAVRYDRAAPDEVADMKLFARLNITDQPRYDELGKTAMDCLQRRMHPDEGIPGLWSMWSELREECLHETI
jgi:tetratricopeptide (TPR) repeat protein